MKNSIPRNFKILASLTFLSMISQAKSDPSHEWSVQQWKTWRDERIKDILKPTLPSSDPSVINRDDVIVKSASAFSNIQTILNGDPNYFSNNPDLNREMGNFISFTRAQSIMAPPATTSHQLGFSIDDREYWEKAEPFLQFPDFLKSRDFLVAMSDPSTYEAGIASLNAHASGLPEGRRWKVLPFEAQFIKSITDCDSTGICNGRTYGRMIVMVPAEPVAGGGEIDKWILFSLGLPKELIGGQPIEGAIRPVSMISVYRPVPQNNVPARPRVYFMDFIREVDAASNAANLVPTALSHHSKNCYDCHKSAVLSIRPAHELGYVNGVITRLPVGTSSVAGDLNSIIRKYGDAGIPDWGWLDTNAYGPSLGPRKKYRTDEFIRSIDPSVELSRDSLDRIQEAMKCSRCHDDFAPLNYLQAVPNDRDLVREDGASTFRRGESMLRTFIEEGWMPPREPLTPQERSILFRALVKEYCDLSTTTGIFVDWLKGDGGSAPAGMDPLFADLDAPKPRKLNAGSLKGFVNEEGLKSFLEGPSSRLVTEIGSGKSLVAGGKFEDAERVLWNGFDQLLHEGVRGAEGLKLRDEAVESLKDLYSSWDADHGTKGELRLKRILGSSSHGE